MLLSLRKNPKNKQIKKKKQKKTNKQSNKPITAKHTKKQQQHIVAPVYIWRCHQAIALNDQQVGPTSLALLSP